MSTHTHHDHTHDGHEHEGMLEDVELSERARRVLAMEELLAEKGVIDRTEVQRLIDFQEARSPVDGARVVARAWTDADYKQRLLADPEAALLELGYPLVGSAKLAVLENTDAVHHLVVCTLCSCYPTSLLGLPPDWYKSFAYRSRAVVDPRGVMREFGLDVGDVRGAGGRQHGRPALPRAAAAAGGHGGHDRGGARRAGHAGQHDRRGRGARASGVGGKGLCCTQRPFMLRFPSARTDAAAEPLSYGLSTTGVAMRSVSSMPISRMPKMSFHSPWLRCRHGTRWLPAWSRQRVPPKTSV